MTTINALDCALTYIEKHYMEEVTLDDLMRVTGVSKYSLTRLFKKHFQIPPQRWIWSFRIFVAKKALSYWPELTCQDVAFACGFETPAHFSRVFRSMVGETPQSYKKRLASRCDENNFVQGNLCALAVMAERAFLNYEQIVSRESI